MTDEQQFRADVDYLMQRPEFLRFLLRVIQSAGIFSTTTDGSGERLGRRNLGLEILELVEAELPQGRVISGISASTLTQVLLEEARRPQPEKPNGRKSSQYNRTDELQDDSADAD